VRKRIALLFLIAVVAISARAQTGYTQLASDNFQRANASPITGSWAQASGSSSIQLVSDTAQSITAAGSQVFNNAVSTAVAWPSNQCSGAVVTIPSGTPQYTYYFAVGVRMVQSTTNAIGYFGFIDGAGHAWIQLDNQPSVTNDNLVSASVSVSTGDTIEICANGTTITFYHNGTSVVSVVDSTLTGGGPGLCFFGGTPFNFSSWSGGSIGPAPSITSVSPISVVSGSPQFTLTVTGVAFSPNTVIYWNGTALATTYVSATEVTCVVPASLIPNAGAAIITLVPAPGPVFIIQNQTALNWNAPSSWGTNSTGGAATPAGFNLYRGTASGGPYTKIQSLIAPGTLSVVDPTIHFGYSYFYVVTAVNANASNNESTYSAQASITNPIP
jgi:hypothetical protein